MMAKFLVAADKLPPILKIPLKLIVALFVVLYLAGSLACRNFSGAAGGLWKLPKSHLRHN